MEEMIDSQLEKKFEIDSESMQHVDSTRKWTLFLSIAGFIFLGLMMAVMLGIGIFGSMFAPGMGEVMSIIPMLLIAIIYFFPLYFLLKFSKLSKDAIQNTDSQALSKSLRYLKMHFKYIGILFIVIMSIYVVAGVVMLASRIF